MKFFIRMFLNIKFFPFIFFVRILIYCGIKKKNIILLNIILSKVENFWKNINKIKNLFFS